jgi:asparaginyl-tRNA synthetase
MRAANYISFIRHIKPTSLTSKVAWINQRHFSLSLNAHSLHELPNTLASTVKEYRNRVSLLTINSTITSPSHSNAPFTMEVTLQGWIRTVRIQRTIAFAEFSDGSQLEGLQLILDPVLAKQLSVGSSISFTGTICPSNGKQDLECLVKNIDYLGPSPGQSYPLQRQVFPPEFLREWAHFRPRTKEMQSILAIRNECAIGFHDYFQSNEFKWIHTPLITGIDCEGGGEAFQLSIQKSREISNSNNDIEFFGKPAFLTVSGQLHLEAAAHAFSRVYSFGPTFRADNSHTNRHLSEFWMLEAEVSFLKNLEVLLKLSESSIKHVIRRILDKCLPELEYLTKKSTTKGISQQQNISETRSISDHIDSLYKVLDSPFHRITYEEAYDRIMENSKSNDENRPSALNSWEDGFGNEQEQYIAQILCHNKPVFITEYPMHGRAFYMKEKNDTSSKRKKVLNADLIIPGVGELMGGSIREDRYDILLQRIQNLGLCEQDLKWYMELRSHGTVPHGGFGIGFDRFVKWVTGTQNIRDVILMSRTQGTLSY